MNNIKPLPPTPDNSNLLWAASGLIFVAVTLGAVIEAWDYGKEYGIREERKRTTKGGKSI